MKTIFATTALGLAACGSGGMYNGGDTVDAPTGHDGNSTPDAPSTAKKLTVFTIVLENHDYAEIVGSSNAPYINSLIAQGALATNYNDTNHPSLPNYLHMISGDDQYPGYLDIGPNQWPYFPADKPNLGTQLAGANIKWRSYQESMGTACNLTDAGPYATKHDPFLYFKDQQTGACADTNVDYSNFAADLATNTFRYMWITPNLNSDGHDPATDPVAGLVACDAWMATEVPKILNSEAYKHGGILFITWDEAEGRAGHDANKIPMIIVSKDVKTAGMTSGTTYDHGSYLATVEDLFALPRLQTVTSAQNMMEFLDH